MKEKFIKGLKSTLCLCKNLTVDIILEGLVVLSLVAVIKGKGILKILYGAIAGIGALMIGETIKKKYLPNEFIHNMVDEDVKSIMELKKIFNHKKKV